MKKTHTKKIGSAVFLGSKSLGLKILKLLNSCSSSIEWTIIHPNDSNDPRSVLADFKKFAQHYGLELHVENSATATKKILMSYDFDIGFVCGYYSLIDMETLSYVPNGLWGAHNSLLPKYRGGSPLVWSIINGDTLVGCSVFKISERMDGGDLLLQIQVTNEISDDIQSLMKKIEDNLLAELPKKWSNLINGEACLSPQAEENATYCGQRTKEDGLIDWKKPAVDIHNFIRAQSAPYPCAYTFLLDRKVLILKSKPSNFIYDGTPGQILRRSANSVFVACGNRTAIEILEVAINEKPGDPAALIRSVKQRFRNKSLIKGSSGNEQFEGTAHT